MNSAGRIFDAIRLVHVTSLEPEHLSGIRALSHAPVEILESIPESPSELCDVLGDADALIVSTRVPVTGETIRVSKRLRYIGVYGTYRGLVDSKEAEARRIVVTNVDGYCDVETAQFTMDRLVEISEGRPVALGIVGMGRVGRHLARLAAAAGHRVLYTSRTRKMEVETDRVRFGPIDEVLRDSDVISLQVPVGTTVLGDEDFRRMGEGKVVIDTARDLVMDREPLRRWLESGKNRLVLDSVAGKTYPELGGLENVVVSDEAAWSKPSSRRRLGEMLVANLLEFLNRKVGSRPDPA